MVRLVESEMLQSCLTEPLGLPVFMRLVGGGEIVTGAGYSAYEIEELGNTKFLTVD